MTTLVSLKQALKKSNARYRALQHSLRDAYLLTRLDGKIEDSNRALQVLVGYSAPELCRMTHADLTPSRWHALDSLIVEEQVARTGASEVYDKEYLRSDGTVVPVEVRTFLIKERGKPAGMWSLIRDITERRRAFELMKLSEDALRAAQRLEAVGRLAGGVAHDYNNLLTAILGYADLIADRLPPGVRLRADIDEVRSAAERAAALTKQLLAFSKQQVLQPASINISAAVQGMQDLIRRLVREDIEVVATLAADLPTVWADPVQITQVVANLVVNAADAMPHGGCVTIETAETDIDGAVAGGGGGAPGRAVTLTVRDTGVGIPADVLPHIFEPFYTSKGVGNGTGLGLAAVYGIVTQSGGHIDVDSTPGFGTTFTVSLPVALSTPGSSLPRVGVTQPAGSRATVLVVEDDANVRMVVGRMLERDGYSVIGAANGREALDIARRALRPIDAVLADVVMPGMSGVELAATLRETFPALAVVLMSGYANAAALESIAVSDLANFVSKPFEPDALLRRLHQALAHRPSGVGQ